LFLLMISYCRNRLNMSLWFVTSIKSES
jgi:hypothetical protein